jgi:putative acetyltransferase
MIRPYQKGDMDSIIDVWYQASLIAHPFLTEAFLIEEKNKLREIFLPNSQTWVYEEESQVFGFISLMDNEVGGIFVRPSKQRQGIGKALMDKARSLHDSLELDVFAANKSGRAFYANYGFAPIRKYWEEETGETVIRLRYEPEKLVSNADG